MFVFNEREMDAKKIGLLVTLLFCNNMNSSAKLTFGHFCSNFASAINCVITVAQINETSY